MCESSISRSDVQGRSRVWELAPIDPDGAAVLARKIKHPWYRCQALARVAECSRGPRRSQLLAASILAAQEQSEPNRVVTVSSWPARVLAGSAPTEALSLVRQLVGTAELEVHNLRRAHALQALGASVADYRDLLGLVVPALVRAILGGGGPRMDRVIRETFELVRTTNPELLQSLALHHKVNAKQQMLLASLSVVEI